MMSQRETTAYKGYLIRRNPLSRNSWIEKDGYRIAGCQSEADGYAIVDSLTEAPKERRVAQLIVEHERRVRAFSYPEGKD